MDKGSILLSTGRNLTADYELSAETAVADPGEWQIPGSGFSLRKFTGFKQRIFLTG